MLHHLAKRIVAVLFLAGMLLATLSSVIQPSSPPAVTPRMTPPRAPAPTHTIPRRRPHTPSPSTLFLRWRPICKTHFSTAICGRSLDADRPDCCRPARLQSREVQEIPATNCTFFLRCLRRRVPSTVRNPRVCRRAAGRGGRIVVAGGEVWWMLRREPETGAGRRQAAERGGLFLRGTTRLWRCRLSFFPIAYSNCWRARGSQAFSRISQERAESPRRQGDEPL
jgi:hypothetical protein